MKGARDCRRYLQSNKAMLKAYHYDDLWLFKLQACKLWYKRNRRVVLET